MFAFCYDLQPRAKFSMSILSIEKCMVGRMSFDANITQWNANGCLVLSAISWPLPHFHLFAAFYNVDIISARSVSVICNLWNSVCTVCLSV